MKKGKKFFIVTFKEIDDSFIYCELLRKARYKEIKEDEYIKILDVIEIK